MVAVPDPHATESLPVRSTAFGLEVHSSHPVPGLGPPAGEATSGEPPLRVRLGSHPARAADAGTLLYESGIAPGEETPNLQIWRDVEGWLRIAYRDGCEFLVDPRGCDVWAQWPQPFTADDAAIYLLGPVAGICLRLRGLHALHAAVVVVDGQAIAFTGGAGAGKSTTAAAFARAGYPVLTDDLAVLRAQGGRILASPAYPRVKLWNDSAAALFGHAERLDPLTPNWDKRFLALGGEDAPFATRAAPLRRLYLLQPGGEEESASLAKVPFTQAFVELSAALYVTPALRSVHRAEEFAFINRLASMVPPQRLLRGDGVSAAAALVDAVVNEVRARRR
jgi:hypothetical protein